MNKKKILIVHNVLWSHYAGKVFSEIYKICTDNNIDFYVIHIAKTSRNRKLGDIDYSLHEYPYEVLFDSDIEAISFIKRFKYLLKEIRKYNPDVILTSGYNDLALDLIVFLNKIKGKKTIFQTDTTYFDKQRNLLKEFFKRNLLKIFDYAFCVGTAQINYLKTLNFNIERIFKVSWYAVDSEQILAAFSESFAKRINTIEKLNLMNKNFIYAGRLSAEKNLKTLISAFKEVKNNGGKDWGLIIVGDGADREELEKIVRVQNIPNVFFAGGVFWKDVPKYYALSDVFILPSLSEPWGLVVNEAMICGLPVIVSEKAGSAELIKENENGFIFNPNDKSGLISIMLKFTNNEVDAKKMSESSKNMIKNYSPKKSAEGIIKSIISIL